MALISKQIVQYLWIASGILPLATSALADCESMRQAGTIIAETTQISADDFDSKSRIYNEKIQIADRASMQGNDLNLVWPSVLSARDTLLAAAETAKTNLAAMNEFNLKFLQQGCFVAKAEDIQTEYMSIIYPINSSMAVLARVPDDWHERYHSKAKIQTCTALNEQTAQNDADGEAWSNQYDHLIEAYDNAKDKITGVDITQAQYPEYRQNLIATRDKALPGVTGYPAILIALYETTMAKQAAGCITMTPAGLVTYQESHQGIIREIKDKKQEMLAIETTFAAPVSVDHIELALRIDPEPVAATATESLEEMAPIAVTPTNGQIRLRNSTAHILCLYRADTSETNCNMMPGSTRSIDTNQLVIFGGGYWSGPDGYKEMKICKILYAAPEEQRIVSGLETGCVPSRP